nr:Zinc finger domain containing protein [Haemonchus contortus]
MSSSLLLLQLSVVDWLLLLVLLIPLPVISASSPWKMVCNNEQIVGNSNAQVAPGTTFSPWSEDFCSGGTPLANTYFLCNECRKCLSKLQNLPTSVLVISRDQPPAGLSAIWFQTSNTAVQGMCTLTEAVSSIDSGDGSTDALRSFSKTSVLFVSISFIILMVISLAWLVFYYVQRFRYAHAKDRLQRRLFNAARKALMRIPTRCLKVGDPELDIDCAVCIDPYQTGDVVRTLPCRHVYHKSCIDPWLLEHRTCPMCKADILKYFGYQVSSSGGGDASRIEADRDREESPEPPSSTESNGAYQFPQNSDLQDNFHFTPNTSPQLVMSASSAKAFAIVPLTVHSKTLPPIVNSEQSTSRGDRGERASSASTVENRMGPARVMSQGQVVNLVQVRTRAMSTTGVRAATLRKSSDRPPSQPTPIEAATTPATTDVV